MRFVKQRILGVRWLVLFNRALLGKWMWRFARERDKLWRRVVAATKYGIGRGDWCSRTVIGSHGQGLWKGIWLGRDEFWKRTQFKVRNGARVRF